MTLMKRLLAALMMLCMLLPLCVWAEEETAADPFGDTIVIDAEDAQSAEDEVYIPEEDEELASAIEILDAEIDDTVDPTKLDLNENLPDHVVNILLVGIDGRTADMDSKNSTQHGDVQIIVSINKQDGSIKLTSVLRDLYVTIPGYKSKNRINVAYSRGGGQLAMRTMNKLLELNIEHYVVINFYGLASIIDSLGGVDIELTKAEAGAINTYIKKNLKKGGYDNQDKNYERQDLEKKNGVQHLDGIQAVMYARLRSIDNDFKRSERQRHLLEVLLAKVLDGGLDMDKLLKLMEICLPYAETNMSAWNMMELAMGVLNSGIMDKLSEGATLLEQNRVPMDETWKYDTTSGGASVVVFRTTKRHQENIEGIHKFIYGEYIPAK
ncbi:MAG: LCP family protein [Clostridia bacterium]|nr:LCP family protein [Clostridia bacterium]